MQLKPSEIREVKKLLAPRTTKGPRVVGWRDLVYAAVLAVLEILRNL